MLYFKTADLSSLYFFWNYMKEEFILEELISEFEESVGWKYRWSDTFRIHISCFSCQISRKKFRYYSNVQYVVKRSSTTNETIWLKRNAREVLMDDFVKFQGSKLLEAIDLWEVLAACSFGTFPKTKWILNSLRKISYNIGILSIK